MPAGICHIMRIMGVGRRRVTRNFNNTGRWMDDSVPKNVELTIAFDVRYILEWKEIVHVEFVVAIP